jgi:histidinol-phosphatase (PHP family)
MKHKRRLVDYHVHSTHSCDGKSSIIDMCQKAMDLGLAEIGFSEHADFDPSDEGFGFLSYEKYSHDLQKARQLFEEKLCIRKGVEVDYQSRFEEQIRSWLQGKEFDFIIGSVHYVDGELINQQLLTTKNLAYVYARYFDELIRSIKSRLFDVVGHLDIVRKYAIPRRNVRSAVNYASGIRTILKETINQGLYLEINSKPSLPGQGSIITMPSRETIRKYIDYGGRLISVGSDAHSTRELSLGVQNTLNFLENLNESEVSLLFEKEKTMQIKKS